MRTRTGTHTRTYHTHPTRAHATELGYTRPVHCRSGTAAHGCACAAPRPPAPHSEHIRAVASAGAPRAPWAAGDLWIRFERGTRECRALSPSSQERGAARHAHTFRVHHHHARTRRPRASAGAGSVDPRPGGAQKGPILSARVCAAGVCQGMLREACCLFLRRLARAAARVPWWAVGGGARRQARTNRALRVPHPRLLRAAHILSREVAQSYKMRGVS